MWYNLFNSAQTAQEKRKGYSMKIVLVGGGKVGTALARQLSANARNYSFYSDKHHRQKSPFIV